MNITITQVNAALDEWWRDALEGSSPAVRDALKARSRDRMRQALQAAFTAREKTTFTCGQRITCGICGWTVCANAAHPEGTDGDPFDAMTEHKAHHAGPAVSPDCREGKHRACDGRAWDDGADAVVDCGCTDPTCECTAVAA